MAPHQYLFQININSIPGQMKCHMHSANIFSFTYYSVLQISLLHRKFWTFI